MIPTNSHGSALPMPVKIRHQKNPKTVTVLFRRNSRFLILDLSFTAMAVGEPTSADLTILLGRIRAGDESAREKLWPIVHDELRRMAAAQLRSERTDHTLQPTALVNEVFLRLNGGAAVDWKNRAHFFALASKAMRRVLVDHARGHDRVKRGGEWQRIDFNDVLSYEPERSWELVALDEALDRLAVLDPRLSQIVELRYFGGLTEEETAVAMNLSSRSIKREWGLARAWLWGQLKG